MKKLSNLKKPSLYLFVEILETLAEQGFIDVEPTEREYDLTEIYDFLVVSGLADYGTPPDARFKHSAPYWLRLANEDACLMLAKLLKESPITIKEIEKGA